MLHQLVWCMRFPTTSKLILFILIYVERCLVNLRGPMSFEEYQPTTIEIFPPKHAIVIFDFSTDVPPGGSCPQDERSRRSESAQLSEEYDSMLEYLLRNRWVLLRLNKFDWPKNYGRFTDSNWKLFWVQFWNSSVQNIGILCIAQRRVLWTTFLQGKL